MLRLVVTLSLLFSAVALDLSKFTNVPPQEISDDELGKLMEEIHNSDTRKDDLKEYELFLLENAKTSREVKLVESFCDLITAALEARRVTDSDATIYPPELYKKIQEKMKQLPSEVKRQWFAENFESPDKVSEEDNLPAEEDIVFDSEGRECRYVRLSKEDVRKAQTQAKLEYYHFLRPEERFPVEVTEDIHETVKTNAYSKSNTDEKARAGKDYVETVTFLDKGLKKVYLAEKYNSIGQIKISELQRDLEDSLDDEEEELEFGNEIFDDNETGREFQLASIKESEIEELHERQTLKKNDNKNQEL